MHPSHETRRVGRFLAAWLLLWFIAMGANPPPSSGGRPGGAPVAGADRHGQATSRPAPAAHANAPMHEGAHGAAQWDEAASAGGFDDDHAGHASGSLLHCPLCLHAAAPAPVFQPDAFRGAAPSSPGVGTGRVHVRARTTPLPPARGPPVSC